MLHLHYHLRTRACLDCDPSSQWRCDDRCIDASKRCDGYRDCYDYTDELNCQGFYINMRSSMALCYYVQ